MSRLLFATALISGLVAAVQSGPATAAGVSDVAASVNVPLTATGAFPATATITNTGTVPQPAATPLTPGSTITISVTNATLSGLPAGCSPSGASAAVCSAGLLTPASLLPPGSQSFTATVTPVAGAVSVATTAVATAAVPELPANALNDTATASTAIYGVDVEISSEPSTVRNGDDTLLTVDVTNLATSQDVTSVITTGGTRDTIFDLPADCVDSAPGEVTCTTSLGTGGTASYAIAAASPADTAIDSMTSSVTATGSTAGSDTDSVDTALDEHAAAFVAEGDSLCDSFSLVSACLYVTGGSTNGGGVFVEDISQVNSAAMNITCGDEVTPCGTGARVIWTKGGDYTFNDSPANIDHPGIITVDFDPTHGPLVTCNGQGSGADCWDGVFFWTYDNDGNAVAQPLEDCVTPGHLNNVDEPCLDKVENLPGTGGGIRITVLILHDTIIPPIQVPGH